MPKASGHYFKSTKRRWTSLRASSTSLRVGGPKGVGQQKASRYAGLPANDACLNSFLWLVPDQSMRFSVFLPVLKTVISVPIGFLSGKTCEPLNFVIKK